MRRATRTRYSLWPPRRWPPERRDGGADCLATRGAGFAQAAVDAVGGFLHRQFAQRGQVGRREERLQGLSGLFGHIDLALLQASDQFARRQIDQHDVVQAVEHAVGHGLADAHAGDPHHHVVEAFQMLDVDRGPDVDAGVQQLHHILPAPLMAAARRVAMGQFIHQHQRRMPCQHGVQVHLLQGMAVIGHVLQRQLRQALQQGLGIGASMGFHQAHHQVDAAAQLFLRAGQHGVGLAHARRRTEEHGQLAAGFALQAFNQGIGLAGTCISHGGRCHGCHCARSRCRPASRCLGCMVQREVQRHHVHPWLAEQAPLAPFGMGLHQCLHALHRQATGTRYARHLQLCGGRRQLRIETAAGLGYQLGRNLRWRDTFPCSHRSGAGSDALGQRGIAARHVGTGRGHRVVVGADGRAWK